MAKSYFSNPYSKLPFAKEQDLNALHQFKIEGLGNKELQKRYDNYRRMCLHCCRYSYSCRVPLRSIMTGTKSREVSYMDFLCINELGSVLAIMDSYSRKIMLKQVEKEDAINAAKTMIEWDARLALSDEFMLQTDGGSHFAHELMIALLTELRGTHKMTIAYASFTNGSIENSLKDTLKFIRQFTSELGLAKDE